MEIEKEIRDKTVDCTKDFACIKNKDYDHFKVENNIDNKFLFIKCLEKEPCNYKMGFGYSFVCTCPTRNEIYKKYRK